MPRYLVLIHRVHFIELNCILNVYATQKFLQCSCIDIFGVTQYRKSVMRI